VRRHELSRLAAERERILAPFSGGEPAFATLGRCCIPVNPTPPPAASTPVDFVDRPECFDFVFVTDGSLVA